jgi:hypothetical protein
MTDEADVDEGDIPSRRGDLLDMLRSAPIARLTRYSWSPKEVVAAEKLRPELVFSHTAGPLLITLASGLSIGAASQPSLMSVVLWHDRPPGLGSDPELYPIEADDPRFSESDFGQMLGQRPRTVSILERDPHNAKAQGLPREAGVLLTFDNAPNLVLSHGLHDDSDDFSVLLPKYVQASLWPQLHEFPIAL